LRLVIDIECNALRNPTKIWVIACKNIDTGELNIFRRVSDDLHQKQEAIDLLSRAVLFVGHNWLEYDYPVLNRLLGFSHPNISDVSIDTLILSRLVDYSRKGGHSIEQYGVEFGLEKGKFNDWSKYSQELEDYCVRDVEICSKIYDKYLRIITDPDWQQSIRLEHRFQLVANDLHNNGFGFDVGSATRLLARVEKELKELDDKILKAFPPREVLIREFCPKATKFGTINRSSVPRSLHTKIHEFEVGKTYRHTRLEDFNPSSHKQLIEVLNNAGWRPTDKTTTHIDTERQLSILGRSNRSGSVDSSISDVDISALKAKLEVLRVTGWKINEDNLSTLPDTAPEPARLLAKRILLESRRRSLTEWLSLCSEDGRIHGKFQGIGAWTHRMSHQQPNTANIPRELKEDGSPKLLGKEMRELWCAPRNRLLVGVDAEGIQLRVFAHYIEDQEFTDALVHGKKSDKTDPHSLNQRVLGSNCKTRQAAKRFVYALLLGGGITKLSQILGASESDTKEALNRLLRKYTGFARLKKETFPRDARRGYFVGLDGRKVSIPGESQRDREHLAMSGYLQNGEAIIVKRAAIIVDTALHEEKNLKKWMFVDIVHDELQSEVRHDWHLAERVAKIKAQAIEQAGKDLNLKCPMAGSYWNDDHNKPTIGKNWYVTH